MSRRVLLVDDEVAVLLTLKAVLEINDFVVETAASAREARLKLRSNEYALIISDMRMESDEAGAEVLAAARKAPYRPAIALLTAFPIADEDWQGLGAHHMLVKPMQTRLLLEQIDRLLESHAKKLKASAAAETPVKTVAPRVTPARKTAVAKKPVKASKPAAAARKPRVTKSTAGSRARS